MSQIQEFYRRRDGWCLRTGLKVSIAGNKSVLPWMNKAIYPGGFDHTGVYYSPKYKVHILITEPYHTAVGARDGLMDLSYRKGGKYFAWKFGAKGTGLWYPGSCFALLVGGFGSELYLQFLAKELPTS